MSPASEVFIIYFFMEEHSVWKGNLIKKYVMEIFLSGLKTITDQNKYKKKKEEITENYF